MYYRLRESIFPAGRKIARVDVCAPETREVKKGKDPRGIAADLNIQGVYVIDGQTACKDDESGELMSRLASGVDEARDIAINGGG
jgi:hypothetical protein